MMMATSLRRNIALWPEEQYAYCTGIWRANTSKKVLTSDAPNTLVMFGLTMGTRLTGTPWKQHTTKPKSWTLDQWDPSRRHPRVFFNDGSNTLRPGLRLRPYEDKNPIYVKWFVEWQQKGYHVWCGREDWEELLHNVTEDIEGGYPIELMATLTNLRFSCLLYTSDAADE